MTLNLKSLAGISFLSLHFFVNTVHAQVINTVAGNGINSFCGDGGQATSACLTIPSDVDHDAAGNMYIASGSYLRKVNTSGVISTIAGNGTSGFSGDGGPAVNAGCNGIVVVKTDATGNIYIGEYNRIRKINTSGIITTIAGTGASNYNGDNIPATAANIFTPSDIIVDGLGNVYFSDDLNNRVRKISTGGIITTVAGAGAGTSFGDGGPATSAGINGPTGLCMDAQGNIYIADEGANRIRKVSTTGIITAYAGPSQLFNTIRDIDMDSYGNMYVSARNSYRVYMVNSAGYIAPVAGTGTWGYSGDGGSALLANIRYPEGICCVGDAVAFVDNYSHRVRRFANTAVPAQPSMIQGSDSVCPNSTYTFYVPASGDAQYYSWTLPPGWIGNSTTGAITVTTNGNGGNLSVTAYNSFGASITRTMAMAIDVTQAVAVLSTNDTVTCMGVPLHFSAMTGPGFTYKWYINNWLIPDSTASTLTSDIGQGWYKVVVMNAGGCSVDADSVYIPPLTVTMVTMGDTVCEDETVSLHIASNVNANISYQWQHYSTPIPGATGMSYTATVSGIYSVQVTAGNCYSTSTAGATVLVSERPDVTISSPGPLYNCPGAPPYAFSVFTNMPVTYQWKKDGVNIPGATTDQIAPSVAGNYSVVLTNVFGCDTVSQPVSVQFPIPQSDISVSGPTTFCSGGSVTLYVPFVNTTYSWIKDGNYYFMTDSFLVVTEPGEYSIEVTLQGCNEFATPVIVTVPYPEAYIDPAGTITICEGEMQLLQAMQDTDCVFQWYRNGTIMNGSTTPGLNVALGGDYTVIASIGSCADTSDISTVVVSPVASEVITQNGNLLSVPAGYNYYQWFRDGSSLTGATSNTYTVTMPGYYHVVLFDGVCEGSSDTVGMLLSVPGNNALQIVCAVSPNPFIDEATLSLDHRSGEVYELCIYNSKGALVSKQEDIGTGEVRIQRHSLTSGLYYYHLRSNEGRSGSGKLVVK